MKTPEEYAFASMMKRVNQMLDDRNHKAIFNPSHPCRPATPLAFQPGSWIPFAPEGGLTEEEILEILGWPI